MILSGVKKKQGSFSLSIDSFTVPQPGIYGLIGPNGCGKSTLAKIITGLLAPDSGTVDTEGLAAKDITYLSRKPYMMEDTVYNNLVYPLTLRNIKPQPEELALFLDKMKFTQRANQRAKSLSGGEQQKLAFLRAVIFKPKLIIADEAMTAMDMESLELFENTIVEEQAKEKSIWIIVSHQMPHINRICKKIYTMSDGEINETAHR
ncbi:MAG: ABC transporter ATP-binding protein [Treponema sp.]|nr:ABC transporter ATP-binding protein [Treponema sp.]